MASPWPLGADEAPLRRQVGIHHHKASLRGIIADGLQQEAFTTAVFADDKAKGRAAIRYDIDIPKQRVDFPVAAHCDIFEPHPRHNAALKRVENRAGDPLGRIRLFH